MNNIDFEEQMQAQLGGNLVDVELTDDDYELAFKLAKKTYQQKGNDNFNRMFTELPVVAGTATYNLAATTQEITRIIKPSAYFTDNPFSQAMVNDLFSGIRNAGGGSLATYELSAQMIENIDIYTANAASFNFNRITKTIQLLSTPAVTETWIMDTFESLTDAQYRDVLWVQEWALAELKIMLGRAYSKFQALSSPTGETSIGGDIMLSEGREDKERLLEDIKLMVDGAPIGLPIMVG